MILCNMLKKLKYRYCQSDKQMRLQMEQIKKIFKNLGIEITIVEEKENLLSFTVNFDDLKDAEDTYFTYAKMTTQVKIENDVFNFIGNVLSSNKKPEIRDVIDSRFYKYKKELDNYFILDDLIMTPFNGIDHYVLGYQTKGCKSPF